MIELAFRTALQACPHDGRPAQVLVEKHRALIRCTRCSLEASGETESIACEKWNDRASETRKFLAAKSAADDRFAYLRYRADVRRCCGDPANLAVSQERPDLIAATCRSCGTRHRKLKCEPLRFSTLFA